MSANEELTGTFDPSGDYGQVVERLEQAGDFMVCFTSLIDRYRSKQKGSPFVRLRGEVLLPEKLAGATFTRDIWLTAKAAKQLKQLCEHIGVTRPFNVSDDRDMLAALAWQPFKARFVESHRAGKVYIEMDRTIPDVPNEALKYCEALIARRISEIEACGDDVLFISDYQSKDRGMGHADVNKYNDDWGGGDNWGVGQQQPSQRNQDVNPQTGLRHWDRPATGGGRLPF